MITLIKARLIRSNRIAITPLLASIHARFLSTVELNKYYSILNVNSQSSTKEIRESFLKQSKIYHPDNRVTGSHAKFLLLKEAYDALKDGHPTVNTSYSHEYPFRSNDSYSRYNDYKDFTYRNPGPGNFHTDHKHKFYSRDFEDELRFRKYQYQSGKNNQFGRGLVSSTLIFSAIAWVVFFIAVSSLFQATYTGQNNHDRLKRQGYYEYYRSQDEKRKKIYEAKMRAQKAKSSKPSPASTEKPSIETDAETFKNLDESEKYNHGLHDLSKDQPPSLDKQL